MRNKTDRNDARGIAQLVRLGWFRRVHVESEEAQGIRMLLVNRQQLLTKTLDFENSMRGSLKVFGLRIGTVTRRTFEARAAILIITGQRLDRYSALPFGTFLAPVAWLVWLTGPFLT